MSYYERKYIHVAMHVVNHSQPAIAFELKCTFELSLEVR